MKNNHKISKYQHLQGFTLLETLFVILLTSIVVSLIFVYFNTFQRYIIHLNKSTEYELQVFRFESLMQYDLDRSTRIVLNTEYTPEIYCFGTNISYTIGDKYIARTQQEVTDTLKAVKIDFTPQFFPGSDSLLEAITVGIEDVNNRTRSYSFYKIYDEKTNFEEFMKTKSD
jgi:type II secretory pathway pseudopilin PulG